MSPHLQPLRDGADVRHEWKLLAERRRVLRLELAEIEAIMDGLLLQMVERRERGEDVIG